MLKKLRKRKTAKKIWIVLIILVLPAFLFWGFGSFMRDRENSGYAGAIAGKRITVSEYADALNAVKNRAVIQFGDNFEDIQNNLNLKAQAWERLLLLKEAKKRRLNASDKEVVELVQNYPFFKGRDGRFDQRIYSQMLEYVFRTPARAFEEEARQDIVISKLYKTLTEKIKIDDAQLKEEYRRLNEQIDIDYILASPADFAKEFAPQEEELKSYYAGNSLRFKQPVSFNLEFVSIDADGRNGEAAEETIRKLAAAINSRKDFAKAAGDAGLEVRETGQFFQSDPIPAIGWSPEISALVLKLKTGEFSPVIRMDKKYYLLRLKERKESYVPDFPAIKERVKEEFIRDRAQAKAKEKLEPCLKEIKGAEKNRKKTPDFAKLAKAAGLKSASTGLFKYGSYIKGVGSSDSFFTEAEKLQNNQASEIISLASGFYIIRVKTRVTASQEKFKAEKEELAKRLLAQKKLEYFSDFLEGLKKNLRVY